MTSPRRLGKRGSYRLGSLRAPAPRRVSPPAPHQPSFAPRPRGPALGWAAGCLGAAVVIAGGSALGWWFVPFIVGVAAGIAARYGRWPLRVALLAVTVTAAAGWGIPLWWSAWGAPAGATARVVAALAGLPPHAAVAIVVTVVVAVIQALAGLWLGRALTPRPERG
jgi:hypothetical protein